MSERPWRVNSVRFTVFTTEALTQSPEWWGQIFGGVPDSSERRPKEGVSQDTGPLELGSWSAAGVLQSGPGRIDILVGHQVGSDFDDAGLPTIGEWPGEFETLCERVAPWLSRLEGDIARLAISPILFLPVASRIDGYQLLGKYLPFRIPDDLTEVAIQFNRPTEYSLGGDGFKVNRLLKVSVSRFQATATADFGTHVVRQQSESSLGARLEVDVSSAEDALLAINQDQRASVFIALRDVVSRAVESGV